MHSEVTLIHSKSGWIVWNAVPSTSLLPSQPSFGHAACMAKMFQSCRKQISSSHIFEYHFFDTHNISRKSTQFEKSRKFLACVTHPEALKCSRTVKLQPDTDSNPKPFIFQRMTSSFAWLPPWPQRNDQSLNNWQECQFFKCCRSTNQSIQEF